MFGFGALILTTLLAGSPPADSRGDVAACRDAVLGNPPAGDGPIRFAEYAGWAEAAVDRPDGLWEVKMGAAVRGKAPVTVRVLPRHQDRAALISGGRESASRIRVEPCRDHRRSTGWAGGVRLSERRPFTIEIRTRGHPPVREVLLDKPRRLPKA